MLSSAEVYFVLLQGVVMPIRSILDLKGVLAFAFLLPLAITAASSAHGEELPIGICQSTAQGAAKFAAALWKGAEIAINGGMHMG